MNTGRQHSDYNRTHYTEFVCHHGNWDIYADATGHCAAIPSPSGEAAGCNATHFGDMDYVRVALPKELAQAQAEKAQRANEAAAVAAADAGM